MDQAQNSYMYANIRIKQETLSWNWNQSNPQVRRQKQEELNEKFKDDFFQLVNIVVESGGTVCLDRHSLDNEWRLYSSNLRVKIPKDQSEKIKTLPFVESFSSADT